MPDLARSSVVDVYGAKVVQEHPLVLLRVVPLVGQILLEPRAAWEEHRSSINRIESLVYLYRLGVRLLSL